MPHRWLFIVLMFSAAANAQLRYDYDLDKNGLIEIEDLADLNEIRHNLDGKTLYGSNRGCPAGGCRGFELSRTLDFDTNGDGKMDAQDTYWNLSRGWEPLGNDTAAFTAIFDGRGFGIRNLYVAIPLDSASEDTAAGLFGAIQDGQIKRLVVDGPLTQVSGPAGSGLVAGHAANTHFSEIALQGRVAGSGAVGGLIGEGADCDISAIALAVEVKGEAGTLINGLAAILFPKPAFLFPNPAIRNVLMSAYLVGGNTDLLYLGTGVLTTSSLATLIRGSGPQVPKALSRVESVRSVVFDNSPQGQEFPIQELRCPTAADNVNCSTKPLYTGWAKELDAQGKPYWDFGSNQQLPGLRLFGRVFRDSDGDGVWDDEDAFPLVWQATQDTDRDGIPDKLFPGCDENCRVQARIFLDNLPTNVAASVDTDDDGYPEAWNSGCDSHCQQSSGLTLDALPNDSDNDGTPNSRDEDENGDGLPDADRDGNGLVEVSSLGQLDAIRFNPLGTGRTLSSAGPTDASGCPKVLVEGVYQNRCHGYELTRNLDFDTNQNGIADKQDTYWNQGQGWQPIAHFYAELDGHGFVIANLQVRRPQELAGLFGDLHGQNGSPVYIHRLAIRGPLTSVEGSSAGLLAGKSTLTRLEEIVVSGRVRGSSAGSLIGSAWSTSLIAIAAAAVVTGEQDGVGPLVGLGGTGNTLRTSFVTGSLDVANGNTADQFLTISRLPGNNMFASLAEPNTQQTLVRQSVDYASSAMGDTGVYTLAQLQCPTAANNTQCTSKTLYADWQQDTDAKGQPYWDFGSSHQLPGLRMFGQVFRDSDGDGSFDDDDIAPLDPSYSQDSDGDSAVDAWSLGCDNTCRTASGHSLDQFPRSAAAWRDDDLDGLPDAWAPNCDLLCRQTSALLLDANLGDSDNDGLLDATDTDDNQDGVTDADADSDGLLEIDSLQKLNAMRFALDGAGRRLSADGPSDSSGCPSQVVQGLLQRRCRGYELTRDLDFDSNGDGVIDSQDPFWGEGEGWQPVGGTFDPFRAVFDGQGHTLANLWIQKPSQNDVGLFGRAKDATLTRVRLAGTLTTVLGNEIVGLLVGGADGSQLSEIVVAGKVRGQNILGGLAGSLNNTKVKGVFAAVSVAGSSEFNRYPHYTAGIAGQGNRVLISDSFASGKIAGVNYSSGLVAGMLEETQGNGNRVVNSLSVITMDVFGDNYPLPDSLAAGGLIEASYFAKDRSPAPGAAGAGFNLAQLQCPTAADNLSCASAPLYQHWGDDLNSAGQPIWDFGNAQQLPGLRLAGKLYRDGAGTGAIQVTPLAVNHPPTVTLSVSQDNGPNREVFVESGSLRFEAQVRDADANDKHQIQWRLDGQLVSTGSATTLALDPKTLSLGVHHTQVLVTDNGLPVLQVQADVEFELKEKPAPIILGGAIEWPWLIVLVSLMSWRQLREKSRAAIIAGG